MSPKCAPVRYGVVAVMLHWLSALAIFATIPLGFAATHAEDSSHAAALLRWHLPLGLAILGLTLARILWGLSDSRPDMPHGQPRWQHRLARANHVILYALVLSLCGSGIITVALSHAAPAIFSSTGARLPDISAMSPMAAHVASVIGFIGLLALHLGAVAYHQVYRRDHIFARMRIGRPVKVP